VNIVNFSKKWEFFLQKWAFFLKDKVFPFYARPLDAGHLAYYWCVASGFWCRRSKRNYNYFIKV